MVNFKTVFNEVQSKLPPFRPYLPFATGHSQTLLSHIIQIKTQNHLWLSEIVTLSDGDQLFVEYIDQKSNTTLSVFHGLTGSSSSDYMRQTADIGLENGWNVILVNHRAVHDQAISSKSYHSGRGDDASDVLKWSKLKFPHSQQIAVGFSMSGSILLNLLTGKSGDVKPDFAVVVNAPLLLSKASARLKVGLSRIYDIRFYIRLKKLIQKRTDAQLPLFGTTWLIDELYTSQMNGFKNADDYYEKCSVFYDLNKIKTPTFVLSSYDDPFIDVQDYLNAKWSEYAHVTLMKHGGHMGYFNFYKDSRHGRRWLGLYLSRVLNELKKVI